MLAIIKDISKTTMDKQWDLTSIGDGYARDKVGKRGKISWADNFKVKKLAMPWYWSISTFRLLAPFKSRPTKLVNMWFKTWSNMGCCCCYCCSCGWGWGWGCGCSCSCCSWCYCYYCCSCSCGARIGALVQADMMLILFSKGFFFYSLLPSSLVSSLISSKLSFFCPSLASCLVSSLMFFVSFFPSFFLNLF